MNTLNAMFATFRIGGMAAVAEANRYIEASPARHSPARSAGFSRPALTRGGAALAMAAPADEWQEF
jgi:hypothetical protein